MKYRVLGRSGLEVSAISFGAWALGGDFGTVDDAESLRALHRAVEVGINLFDTADVYGNGRSERLLGRLRKDHPHVLIATKAGRRLDPHVPAAYNLENLSVFVERSLQNLGQERVDLPQLHCPPTDVYYMPEVFDALDRLVQLGKVRYYGVSVERVEEGLKALEFPGVQSVQIIYNLFRQRPAELFFERAMARRVGVLARVPLASGLLTGKLSTATEFEAGDHRRYNRHGEAFDRGETFSGVDFSAGLGAAQELKQALPTGMTLGQFALRWILMHPGVTCAIPGAKTGEQVEQNASAADLPPLPEPLMELAARVYTARIKGAVHQRW